ncbi:MAG: RidA family protein, partial [Azospirillaceae bacterium]
YAAWRRDGNQLWMAGMVPMTAQGILHPGMVGAEVSVDQAREAAVLCVMNSLSLAARALDGDLDRLTGCLKLTGIVRAGADFTDHPAVINAASQRVVDLLGEDGLHARIAWGTPSLPANAPVLLDIVWLVA